METVHPNFSGFGRQLSQVLNALDVHHLEPTWALKETRGKLFLDIVWTKRPFKVPASDVNKGPVQSHIQLGPTELGQECCEEKPTPSSPLPTPTIPMMNNETKAVGDGKNKKKKRKSPSVLRRDKERALKWRERKHQKTVSSGQPNATQDESETVNTPPSQAHDISNNELPSDNEEYRKYLDGEIAKVETEPRETEPEQEAKPPVKAPQSEYQNLSQDEDSETQNSSQDDSDEEFEELYRMIEKEAEEEYSEMENRCFNLNCLKPETTVPGGLKRCTGCKIAFYCSTKCQAKHWKLHRSACRTCRK